MVKSKAIFYNAKGRSGATPPLPPGQLPLAAIDGATTWTPVNATMWHWLKIDLGDK